MPQDCGFLRLPLEIRMRIYEHVIRDWSIGRSPIEPRKNRMKFKSASWSKSDGGMPFLLELYPESLQLCGASSETKANIQTETAQLYLLCRQSYVDVVGCGLIYALKLFLFASPNLMLNYLWVIHPVHLSAIQSIELHINYNYSLSLDSLPFEKLLECTSLKNLFITIFVRSRDCHRSVMHVGNNFSAPYSYALPESLLTKLADWKSIRQLRGLNSFRLNVDWFWKSQSSQSLNLVKDFEESIRSIVMKDGGKDVDWQDEHKLDDRLSSIYGPVSKRVADSSIYDDPDL